MSKPVVDDTVHTVTITISSVGTGPDAQVHIEWDPGLDEFDPRDLGYEPAAFTFMQNYILPMLERAFLQSNYGELLEDSPSDRTH